MRRRAGSASAFVFSTLSTGTISPPILFKPVDERQPPSPRIRRSVSGSAWCKPAEPFLCTERRFALNTLKTCGACAVTKKPGSLPRLNLRSHAPFAGSRCWEPRSRSVADAPADLDVLVKTIGPMGDDDAPIFPILVVVVVPVRTNVNAVRAYAKVQSVCRNYRSPGQRY